MQNRSVIVLTLLALALGAPAPFLPPAAAAETAPAARPAEEGIAAPQSNLVLTWPRETPVRLPASFFMNEIFLHAKIGGRTFLGLVDSGATFNVIDTGSPIAAAFRPAAPPAQPRPFALGEIPAAVAFGDLVMEHMPVAAVPIPSFDEFGARRPEMLVGYPLFLNMAVRIDYARQEFLVAKNAASLHSQNAVSIPMQFMDGSFVAEGKIDGVKGWFVLDTGDSEALDLFKDWAAAQGFPGARPTYTFRQQSEVGDRQTDEKRMRPATFEFGPIRLAEPLVALDSVASPGGRIAGQVGNGVFASCAAMVFDMPNRTLWFEPPCDRRLPEDLAGWSLERKDSPAYPESPWVVRFVIAGGSADRAGVKIGDRLLQLGGQPATLDIAAFESVTKQPPGTKIPAVVLRGDAKQEVTLNLVRLLAR